MSEPRPTRWERIEDTLATPYVRTFTERLDAGEDVDGEARLADVLLPRRARVLDAGSGLGRVAEALRRRGHDVTAVEKDPALVAISRERFPEVPVVERDLVELVPGVLEAVGRPTAYDAVVAVGNVVVYLADDTEVEVLRRLRDLLVEGGRVLLGWHPVAGPEHSRDYPAALLREHAAAAGLVVEHVFGGYGLEPVSEDYVVAVLR